MAFIESRKHDQFIENLNLKELLPIRCAHSDESLAGPASASGGITYRGFVSVRGFKRLQNDAAELAEGCIRGAHNSILLLTA
jgi:hypothetical protein